jgi:murein DD-endopeptidase MepM/ murein hydrolase activator NlpD
MSWNATEAYLKLCHAIFPRFKSYRWGELNLNTLAQQYFTEEYRGKENKLLDPLKCWEWLDRVSGKLNIDFSYGGWLEDRSYLWEGSYLDPKKSIHLGIDINVPVFSEVMAIKTGKVTEIFHDKDQNGGWGSRLMIQVPNGSGMDLHYLYAHLDERIPVSVGDEVKEGQIVGKVATPQKNGNWYPHLHLQCILGTIPEDLDGYGDCSIGNILKYVNPVFLIDNHIFDFLHSVKLSEYNLGDNNVVS